MPQTVINNENEYRFTRSSKIVPQDEATVSSGPAAPVSTSTTTTMTTQSTQNSHKPSTKNADDSSIQVNTREYLGDLSNQDTSHPGQLKRRPLGGDVQPLRQSALVSNNASGTTAKDKELIPPRLPQKRQATESSTNLVEKLHISRHPHPHTSIQVSAVGPAGIQDIAAGSSSSVNVPYKKSKLAPVDYEWEDLDEEDMDDPLMASEYVNDIFPYLRELEIKSLPDSQYLFKQRHLKPKMRSILVDWLVEMHLRFRLLPETLFLAINIMDRFMSLEVVQIDKLQLLATGSLFIAAKYEEVFSPSVKNYAYFTDGSYTEEEILQAEKYILTVLNFDLSYPNPMNFLRRISKADDYDVQSRTLGKYLLEISIIDYKFIGILPSLCSALAMYIARSILSKDPVWNGNLIHYSGGYRVSDMKDCIEKIIAFLVAPVEHDEFFKKYASRKFMKASILCRNWAKKVVQENRDIFV